MADIEQNGVTEETGETQVVEQGTDAENNNENSSEENGSESEQDKKDADLPEWARNELSRVRQEAADRRVQLREAQEALTKAKTPEEFAAATKELTEKVAVLERTILVNSVASQFDLPEALAARLKGDTKEELEADAKMLAQFAVPEVEPQTLRGGLNPSDDDSSFDPVAASRKARSRRY